MKLLEDTNGNFWRYLEYDEQSKLHIVTVVEFEDGRYTDTSITWCLANGEFDNCKEIKMNGSSNLKGGV